MRWDHLIDDLDAQVAAAEAAELAGEVSERTRLERSRLTLADRLLGWVGEPVAGRLVDGSGFRGVLADAGTDWVVVRGAGVQLVPVAAVADLVGLGLRPASQGSVVRRRHGLAAVLRAVARDRSPVRVRLVGGLELAGTIDVVGADHLDLAEHDPEQPRRATALRAVRTVPFSALAGVAPAPGASSLG